MKRGKELLATIKDHERKSSCPVCARAIGQVALVDLVYAFEPCDCDIAKFQHLVETIYHRECFFASAQRRSGEQS